MGVHGPSVHKEAHTITTVKCIMSQNHLKLIILMLDGSYFDFYLCLILMLHYYCVLRLKWMGEDCV